MKSLITTEDSSTIDSVGVMKTAGRQFTVTVQYNNLYMKYFLTAGSTSAEDRFQNNCCSNERYLYYLNRIIVVFAGFFDDAKSDFQQALKLNPDFENAKMSLQQTIMDQQHKLGRGY